MLYSIPYASGTLWHRSCNSLETGSRMPSSLPGSFRPPSPVNSAVADSSHAPRREERIMQKFRKMMRRTEAGFTLIEMLIVVLIVGVLAAVAAPVYFGYVKDAKAAEGKSVVGSVWTALQATAQQSCGVTQVITGAYPRS